MCEKKSITRHKHNNNNNTKRICKKTKENVENAHILRRSTGTQTTMGARLLLQVKLKLSSELGIPSMDDHHQQHSKRNKRRIRIYFFWFFIFSWSCSSSSSSFFFSSWSSFSFLPLALQNEDRTRAREEGTTRRSRAKQNKRERKGSEEEQCSAAAVLCKERRKFTNPFLNWDTLIRITKRGLARERARGREWKDGMLKGCINEWMDGWMNESQFNIFVARFFWVRFLSKLPHPSLGNSYCRVQPLGESIPKLSGLKQGPLTYLLTYFLSWFWFF